MMKVMVAAMACCALAGCAGSAAPSTSQQADNAACTAQADASYNASTVDLQARTAEPGLLYPAGPNHVFDAEKLGAEHARDSQISRCEQNGDISGADDLGGAPPIVPHIVNNP